MSLTPIQEKTLKKYREYKTQDVTVASFMIPAIPRFIAILIFAIVAYVLGSTWLALILLGAWIGVFLRQISLSITASKVTPILLDIIDWDVVDELLATSTYQH